MRMFPVLRQVTVALLVSTLSTVGGLVVLTTPASAATSVPFSSFSAGVFEPGQVKHYVWNNANSDAYAPGLEATGADDPDAYCAVEVSRMWYERQPSGEREFHLDITSETSQRCQVTVWLARLTKYREGSTGDLAPGASRSWVWNNAQTDRYIYAVGALPEQLATGSCKIEVTSRYRTQPDGENEFFYTARNIGSVACSAQLRHVSLPVDVSSTARSSLYPGSRYTLYPGKLSSSTRVVVQGAAPDPTSAGLCTWTAGPAGYENDRFYYLDYWNTGSVACGGTATYALLAI
jgi:hypothetical protein